MNKLYIGDMISVNYRSQIFSGFVTAVSRNSFDLYHFRPLTGEFETITVPFEFSSYEVLHPAYEVTHS